MDAIARTLGGPARGALALQLALQVAKEYRDKVGEKLLRRPLAKPWMKYREIAAMEALLAALRPARCLEWGSGFGSLHFPARLPPDSSWLAVEHEADWARRIRARNRRARTAIVHVPAEAEAETEAGREGDPREPDGAYATFREYVDFPASRAPFDFILVDGRARRACLERARALLAPGGVVALHDANRAYLRDFLASPAMRAAFPRQLLLTDYRLWSGGLWLGGVDRDPAGLLPADRHRRAWEWYRGWGRRLRV